MLNFKGIRSCTFCLLCSMLFFSNCKKNDDLIESVMVDVYLDPTLPSNNNLTVIGGWIYVNAGVKGIIVFKRSPDEFLAFERNCTYLPQNKCTIKVESSNLIAADACCGSRFQLTDGIVVKGPASRGLKQYATSVDKNGVVHVYNYQ
jgi:nitrite reductase/ring-hydroxylating ferredoxin subunit